MELHHIPLDKLSIAPVNARTHGADRDLESLAASIKALGILQPLLVRPQGEVFEIVAGQRRYLACQRLAQEHPQEPLPCLILNATDDATALETSLAENLARLPMDPFDQHEAFARLVGSGRAPADIAADFGVTERLVKQRLALANLIEPIKQAARQGGLNSAIVQDLTLATAKQQRAWWKLYKDPDVMTPTGRTLKAWLCGGASISTDQALFPLADYTGQIVTDLFGDTAYFADSAQFWALQRKAIAAARDRLLAQGWREVHLLADGERWLAWEYQAVAKGEGGAVYIEIHDSGEEVMHQGYQLLRANQRRDTGDEAAPTPVSRREITQAMENYLGLHKAAAVRDHLTRQPWLALRLAVACWASGSTTWRALVDPTAPRNEAIAASVAGNSAVARYRDHCNDLAKGLDLPEHAYGHPLIGHAQDEYETARVFARLLALSDEHVLHIVAAITAATLVAGSGLAEIVGEMLQVNMSGCWQPDDTFLDLLRDKEALARIAEELGEKPSRQATGNALRDLIRRRLRGEGCRAVTAWLPRYLAFPARAYTDRPAFDSQAAAARLAPLFAAPDPATDSPA